jgi:DNA-binding Lrp family transcriptional regulator
MLDDKDRLLIAALTQDARESLVSLARRVGLSRSATQDRLRRLERSGVIQGYTVRVAPRVEAGAGAVIAVALAPGHRCEQVTPHLAKLPQVTACRSVAGEIDLMLTVECAGLDELAAVREAVAAAPGVASAVTYPVLTTHWRRG